MSVSSAYGMHVSETQLAAIVYEAIMIFFFLLQLKYNQDVNACE